MSETKFTKRRPQSGGLLMEDSTDPSPSKPPNQAKESKAWMRFAGLGMELAGYTVALMVIGYAIDRNRGHAKPLCTAFGTLIGFSFGMFRFIQQASKSSQDITKN